MALATVRRAVDADVDALVRIQSDTWRAAYAGLVPAEALAHLSTPAAREAWRAAVSAGGGHHVFVAVEGEWTVGFCAAAHYGGENGASIAEVSTLLVEPRWGRRGHGRRLLTATFRWLAVDGAREGVVWVPEPDVASRAFYDRVGWDSDGLVRTLDAGDREVREIRLAGALRVENRDPRHRSVPPASTMSTRSSGSRPSPGGPPTPRSFRRPRWIGWTGRTPERPGPPPSQPATVTTCWSPRRVTGRWGSVPPDRQDSTIRMHRAAGRRSRRCSSSRAGAGAGTAGDC